MFWHGMSNWNRNKRAYGLFTRRSRLEQRGVRYCQLGLGPARQGLAQPPYPNEGRGLCGPCTPHQGHRPWTHFATYNRIEQNYFRMLVKETKRNSTTGTMKTKKMPVGKACFPTGYFLSFSPDALHPAGGGTPPCPWGGGNASANSQYCTLFLPQRFCVPQ